jgi:Family of unknown function (DUF5906)
MSSAQLWTEQVFEPFELEAGKREIDKDDFVAFLPAHNYVFLPTREVWTSGGVDARLPRVPLFNKDGTPKLDAKGKHQTIPASMWIDENQPIEQMTWAPGHDMLVRNRLVVVGGWIDRQDTTILNLYRRPQIARGDAEKAGPWVAHLRRIYPDDADHIEKWLAHRVQRPGEKLNHMLLLGGAQGIGKDTLLEPVRQAVGPWNYQDVSPVQMLGRFNGFAKSVILRINEARDLGEVDRFKFYEHLKPYATSPPETLRVDEKNLREYYIFNVVGVVMTTNYKTDGVYLPEDDRRTYVAWSNCDRAEFEPDYFDKLHYWYVKRGGYEHVTAYLWNVDLEGFDSREPPPRTPAFWDIINTHATPEDSELADVLDAMGNPAALTLDAIVKFGLESQTSWAAIEWLTDVKKRRAAPFRLERCGYVSVRCPERKIDGNWRIGGKRQVVYAQAKLNLEERIAAAKALV